MTQIEEIAITKLTLLENNPRRISKDQMDKLIKSMKEDKDFLWCRPVLVNRTCFFDALNEDSNVVNRKDTYTVYAGNQRIQAAKKLKWKTIPCIVEENLSEEVMNKRMILDNKSMGEWDFDLLANNFEVDMLLDCGFQDFELSIDTSGKTIEEVIEEEKSKEKKKKECPNCGHSF